MDCLKIASWNIRGAISGVNRHHVRTNFSGENIAILCLQETKCGKWNPREVMALMPGKQVDWAEVASTGLSGGLITVWDSNLVKIDSMEVDRNWIMMLGSVISSGEKFLCVNVYAPQKGREKTRM